MRNDTSKHTRTSRLPREKAMKHNFALLLFALFALLAATAAAQQGSQQPAPATKTKPAAQSGQSSAGAAPEEAPPGRQVGDYVVHQSIEVGGRIADKNGSGAMYNTLVNLQSGPRVLDQELSMQSRTHTGNLFDSLYASSFGWGGDPSNAARLRISKLNWYNFTGSFRRDINYFDYDLFANPLNPPTIIPSQAATTPPEPVNVSPHAYYTTRRMYDFGLTLFPQRRLSFRLAYNRNRIEGPSFNSFHEGTDALLNRPWNITLNGYRLGADVKLLPRTTLSFTEILQWTKDDTQNSLAPYNLWPLSSAAAIPVASGIIASLGLPWQPGAPANIPCAKPVVGSGLANPSCNVFLAYTRNQRVRNFMPTEQLTLMSTSIRRVDITANVAYSTADMTTPLVEFFNGLETRTNTRQYTDNGGAKGSWNSVVTDWGVTVHLTDHVRLVDTFRFHNWHKPASIAETLLYFVNAATAGSANATLPIATYPASLLLHNASSNPDQIARNTFRFLKYDDKSNQFEVQADFTRFLGARVGYRFEHRTLADQGFQTATNTYFPNFPAAPCTAPCSNTVATSGDEAELDSFDFAEHAGIVGLWIRPSDRMRFNFDAELISSGDTETRVSPRHEQQYRGEFSYTPRPWASLGANFNFHEMRNHNVDTTYDGHVRNAGFIVTLAPNDRIGLDLAYNYTNFLQNANICYVGQNTGIPSAPCTATGGTGLLATLGNFSNTDHFGNVALRVKPVSRVSLAAGYSVTDSSGNILILNALQPPGMLSSRWTTPMASIGVGVASGVTLNAGWNYYDYGENGAVGPTLPRNFHSNMATLSVRYAF
jgi:hypothetical protein